MIQPKMLRILIADSEDSILTVLAALLRHHLDPDIKIQKAKTVDEATQLIRLSLAELEPFDLVITEVEFKGDPRKLAVASLVRSTLPDCPIILFYSSLRDIEYAKLFETTAYIFQKGYFTEGVTTTQMFLDVVDRALKGKR